MFTIGFLLFFARNKDIFYQTSWSSVLSWFYVLPVIFILFGLPEPWPLLGLTFFSIYASKTFYQMVGMYHRHWFVTVNYLLIFLTSYIIGYRIEFLNLFYALPMLGLFLFLLIPIFRNNFEHMVQYTSLALICYSLFGWFYLHGALVLYSPQGLYVLIYLYVLSELSVAVCSSLSLKFGRFNLRNKINSKIKLEGFIVSTLITLLAAWGWRRMLPETSVHAWMSAGLIAVLFSIIGDWTLSIIRKDLGIKDHGVFIIGRGDILSRVSKVIFVFPVYIYYTEIINLSQLVLRNLSGK